MELELQVSALRGFGPAELYRPGPGPQGKDSREGVETNKGNCLIGYSFKPSGLLVIVLGI